ncbi:DUF47 domain-containing protein [Olsenella urininfantis]|uniref:DUF47 domain-containing protein n=1 Tax=Olsenella urininfantis TaxID=1871033 RepID=UPI001356551A|nr:DUF47 family protein [Olsenella urininfantis]
MSRVSRKEAVFYDGFKESSLLIGEAAELHLRIIEEWPRSKALIPRMKEYEGQHDALAAHLLDELNRSFITPFDREDINLLVHMLDSIVDGMEGVSARFAIYDVNEVIAPAGQMARLQLSAARELQVLFEHLPDFKKDPVVREKCRAIAALEDEGDIVYRNAMGTVFAEHGDPIHVLKWKSLLDMMENSLDNCKNAVNIIGSVLIKNA